MKKYAHTSGYVNKHRLHLNVKRTAEKGTVIKRKSRTDVVSRAFCFSAEQFTHSAEALPNSTLWDIPLKRVSFCDKNYATGYSFLIKIIRQGIMKKGIF